MNLPEASCSRNHPRGLVGTGAINRLSVLCNVDKHRHISVYRFVPEWQIRVTGFDMSDPVIDHLKT